MKIRHCPATVSECVRKSDRLERHYPEEERRLKSLCFFLVFSFVTHLVYANDCRFQLLDKEQQIEVFTREMERMVKASPKLSKLSIKVRGRLMRNNILKKCSASGTCTEELIIQAMKASLAGSGAGAQLTMQIMIWAGGLAASAALFSGINVLLNENASFRSSFLFNLLTGAMMLTTSALTPFSAQVLGKIQALSHWLKSQWSQPDNPLTALQDTYDRHGHLFPMTEQHASSLILQLANQVRMEALLAISAIKTGEEKAVVHSLALIALSWFQHLRGIEANEDLVFSTIKVHIVNHLENPQRFIEPVIEELKRMDRGYDAKAEKDYRRALNTWLSPRN